MNLPVIKDKSISVQASNLLQLCDNFYKIAVKKNKCLRIFDFDHTLVSTGSKKWVVNKDTKQEFRVDKHFNKSLRENDMGFVLNERGTIAKIPSNWEWDWREFLSDLVEPVRINKDILSKLKILSKNDNCKTVIMTTRSSDKPIKKFLKDHGVSNVEVLALGTEEPNAKADLIEKMMISKGYRDVKFWEDSLTHINAVNRLKKKWKNELSTKYGPAKIEVIKV